MAKVTRKVAALVSTGVGEQPKGEEIGLQEGRYGRHLPGHSEAFTGKD